MKVELSRPIPVRLPVQVREAIEIESRKTGIPESVLIRQCVMRDYFVDGDSTNPQEDTTIPQDRNGE